MKRIKRDFRSKVWVDFGSGAEAKIQGRGFKPHRRHCAVSLTRHINPSLVLVQSRKTHPDVTERLLTGT